jgi:hypothetical protein
VEYVIRLVSDTATTGYERVEGGLRMDKTRKLVETRERSYKTATWGF